MATEDTDSGFLGRWSRRKAQARSGQLPPEPLTPPVVAPAAQVPLSAAAAHASAAPVSPIAPAPAPPAAEPPPPAPTMDDVARLTPEADFSPFVARQTDPAVRNAAMKKLFADPHFNVMDGLDIYIDDYSKPDPLPLEMARQMVSAQFMKLFDEPENAPHAPAEPPLAAAPADQGAEPPTPATPAVAAGPNPPPADPTPESPT